MVVIGVVGPDADAVATVIREAGGDAATARSDWDDADVDAVVAVGESALIDVTARDGPDAPVLPVTAGRGVLSVPRDAVADAVRRLVDGDYAVRERPLLGVTVDGRDARALFDVALVTAEPGGISEYAIAAVDETERPVEVAQFRSDGVVAATPAGSHGYARRADGPVVGPGIDGLAVVPVAPFVVDPDRWVLRDPVTLTVERDEVDVALLVDDARVGFVDSGDPVRIERDGTVGVAVVPGHSAGFDRMEKT